MRNIPRALLPAAAMLLATAPVCARPDFSGAYTLASIQGGPQSAVGGWRMEVRQDENNIEVTTIRDGVWNTNTFPFKRVAACRDRNGEVGTCTAEWHGNEVVLNMFLRLPARPGQPPERIHVRQSLRLSDDLKRLTMRTDRDSDKFPPDPNPPEGSQTEIYTRD